MPDWFPINLDLVKNPLNWAIIALMAFLAFYAFSLLHEAWNKKNATAPQSR